MKKGFLRRLGVYGYDAVEPVILASLVSGDPLLLVGNAGTGKTYLLNSLSEALHLEHRHYNASLIAFDDLVGFPWPDQGGSSMRYIETPATVWKAESVLIDEINRCKPEHQNKLFSLVHERKIQGLSLPNLRYRWAAMNPAGFEQAGSDESYSGCEPLDPALADRFAFVVNVADWSDLNEDDRTAVADPRGEGSLSKDNCGLREFVEEGRLKFAHLMQSPPPIVVDYAVKVTSALSQAGLRLSPRRVRQLSKNLLSLEAVSKCPREKLFRLGLEWSLPQRASALIPSEVSLSAAHRTAWEAVSCEGEEKWLNQFHLLPSVEEKISFLLENCRNPDTGSLAVGQCLAVSNQEERAIFALSLFPALVDNPGQVVGPEGLNDLGSIASEILDIDTCVTWRDGARRPYSPSGGGKYEAIHKEWASCEQVLGKIKGRRKERATQLFAHLLAKGIPLSNASQLEEKFHRSILAVRKYHATLHT